MLAALALAATRVSAAANEEGAGTRAASFLTAPVSPASFALGGSGLAFGRDVQGATLNPAALGWVGATQLSIAHADFGDQSAQEWAALGGRLGHGRTRFGLAAIVRDEGTIEGRDASGVPTGNVDARDLALTLQLARPLGERITVGGAAHLVNQQVGDASGSGFAFDAGAQVRWGLLSFAVAGQDFGGTMRWAGTRWKMPANFATGAALEHAASGLRLALDWNAPADYYRNVRAGAEWCYRDRLALRGGWRTDLGAPAGDRSGGPSFGIGAGSGAWWLDYGFAMSEDGLATHRFGVSLHGTPPFAPRH